MHMMVPQAVAVPVSQSSATQGGLHNGKEYGAHRKRLNYQSSVVFRFRAGNGIPYRPRRPPRGYWRHHSGGKFYRDGEEILTPLEEALKKNAEYEAALSEIETALGVTT